jgi:hypothetical protein
MLMGESSLSLGQTKPGEGSLSSCADYFVLLEQPRRPWLDPDILKARFLELSASLHPDHVHGGSDLEKETANRRCSELNAAYQCLREPKERLGHLLALERGTRPSGIETVPENALGLFMRVGQLCRSVDAFVGAKPNVTSPLLKVERFKEALRWTDQVQTLLSDLQEDWSTEESRLRDLNAVWESGTRPLAECEQTYRRMSYLGRWLSQLRERMTQLSLE